MTISTTNDSICAMTAAQLARAIQRKSLSPVEIVSAALERAHRLQPEFNCFITICGERAMQQARHAEADVMSGRELGPLHGIPFTVKDLVNTADVRTTFGTLAYKDNIPDHDAVSVARLRAAGAILIGKTTTPEFGCQSLTRSPLFGQTRNAWSAERTSGGSSGGAAVATAQMIAPLAVASDGGGSTRIPAACNGVVGLKQSLGVIPHSQAQDVYGNQTYVTPTTRTVEDTAMMLQVMAGEDPIDPWSIGVNQPDYVDAVRTADDLKGKRVLYCAVPPGRPIAADVQRAFDAALQRLQALGAQLESFDATAFNIEPVWRTVNHTVWRTRFIDMVTREPALFSETFRRQVESAQAFSSVDYQRAMFARSALFHHVQGLLQRADFLVTPTLSRTALPIDQDLFQPIDIDGKPYEDLRANWFPWTMVFNMTGHPAISVPCGTASDGLPVGLQLVGRFRQDAELLRAAAAFERASPCERRYFCG
ncbi:amidase [Bordetella sp. 02P26C-1]|uniref:amidase n=1 Tax=Bordetella sp. 02P26C-1 TaxID=2683195 RepID=UPI0013546262|nr:amidase [Bordetella sp. 02P26C-1]MVW79008.1 amidase [Bordetella sp. 02P26C-1]